MWIGIALVFILGSLAGALGMGMYIQHRFERIIFDDPRPGHPPHPPMMRLLMKRLDKELDLTETQRHEIEKIMNQTFESMHSVMREQHPELENLVEGNLERIKEKLTAEQKEKLERLKVFEKMKKRFHHKPPFRPGIFSEKPDERFEDLKERLQFNEAQEKETQPIIEKSLERRQNILEAHRETARRDKHAMTNEIREMQETVEKQLEKILSEEQMNTYREIQEEQRFMHKGMHPPGPHGFGRAPIE